MLRVLGSISTNSRKDNNRPSQRYNKTKTWKTCLFFSQVMAKVDMLTLLNPN